MAHHTDFEKCITPRLPVSHHQMSAGEQAMYPPGHFFNVQFLRKTHNCLFIKHIHGLV